MNKYMCHICNVDVPKSYTKEHSNSPKHKACNAIANIALERTKLQMQLDIATPRKVEISDTYFCEPCALVILNSEKEVHETTKHHKVSIRHDELLTELLKIYSDIDNVEVQSEIDELELIEQQIEGETLETKSERTDTVNTEEDALCSKEGTVSAEENTVSAEVDTVCAEEDTVNAEEDTVIFENLACNLIKVLQEEVLSAIKTSIQSAVDNELQSAASEVTEAKECVDKIKIQAKLEDKSYVLAAKVNEPENNTKAAPLEDGNSKNRVYRKYMVPKKKARVCDRTKTVVHNNEHTLVSNDSVKDVTKLVATDEGVMSDNNTTLKAAVHTSDVAKETKSCDNKTGSINNISKKIDEVMAKYFDSTRTVDALNNNTIREHNKNKASGDRKGKDNIEEKDEKDNQSKVTKEQDKEQNEKGKETNEDNKKQNPNNENLVDNKDVEHNNNTNTEQNKNNRAQNSDYTHRNNQNRELNKNKKTNQKNKTTLEQHQTKETPKNSNPEKSKPSFSLVFYLKDIARKCQTKPIHKVEAITDTIVQITAINGDKIKVPMNNFHSFHVKANDVVCKVCESPNVRRPEWHIAESEHRAKVMLPITDRNGIRQLDDIWNHCILCDDLTRDVSFHLQTLLHKNKLKHCLVELGPIHSDSEETYSQKVSNQRKKNTEEKHTATITYLIMKNNFAVTNKNYLNCVICDVIVNKELASIQQHINSFDHLNNFEDEKNTNKFVDIDENRSYCIACDVNISKYEIVPHCKGKRHRKLLEDLLTKQGGGKVRLSTDETEIHLLSISQNVKKQSKAQIEDSEMICFVCNVILYCVEEHMDSFDHKKSYYSYLEANKLNEIEADTFYCIRCNTVMTIDYLMSHCTSRKHRIALRSIVGDTTASQLRVTNEKLPSQPSTSQAAPYVKPSTGDVKSMPLKLLYQFKEMSDSTKLLCIVCDEEVAYTRKLAQYHISTLDHVVAFNLMMLWNKIKKRDDRYFCDICRIDMTYFSEITHVFGSHHAANLAKEPKGTVYEYDRTLVTHAYAMSHKVGDRVRPSSIISKTKNG